MHVLKAFCAIVFMLVLPVLLIFVSGCAKDYSYEYKPADSTPQNTAQVISSCDACNRSALPDLSWRMTINNTVYCGRAEKAVMAPERTGFTFFGPSFCSNDSGFVATIYVNDIQLTADKSDIQARMSCYYYDKIGSSHVYISKAAEPLQMIIKRYEHQSGLMTGTFRGRVVDGNGISREVKDGRFHIRF